MLHYYTLPNLFYFRLPNVLHSVASANADTLDCGAAAWTGEIGNQVKSQSFKFLVEGLFGIGNSYKLCNDTWAPIYGRAGDYTLQQDIKK
jgi:hypothetical protein